VIVIGILTLWSGGSYQVELNSKGIVECYAQHKVTTTLSQYPVLVSNLKQFLADLRH
jgi:hypothetical protein